LKKLFLFWEIVVAVMVYTSVSQTYLLADSFWLRKIIKDPHLLSQVKIDCPDDRYPKLKKLIS
jgi:hypothetical protein